ncbi:MAG TPA: hypothetical protein VFP87_13180 [Chitinophagaceae bacterium]|nr:hypothetical protein [Chitinophagaceae bacterium]
MTLKIFFLAIMSVCSLATLSQTKTYFEGTITYKFSFEAKEIPDPGKSLTPYFGEGSTLFFKEGNYRHEYHGGLIEYDVYNKKDNKMYLKKRNNDTLYWRDCSLREDSIKNLLFDPKADTVMGITCDRLLIQYRGNSEIHYYNSDSIRINPIWFENFKLNDEYLIDRKEKSIFLKSVTLFDHFTLIETAIKINSEPISIDKFKLPVNAILAAEE